MKPHGIAIGVDASMHVIRSSPVEDAIWDAVQEAVLADWTVKRFRLESASAWEHALKTEVSDARKEWAS